MRKQWFDKRAEDGSYWTLRERKETSYNINTWGSVTRTWYVVDKVIKTNPTDARRFGRMTKEEAVAMAKLLNATLGESK